MINKIKKKLKKWCECDHFKAKRGSRKSGPNLKSLARSRERRESERETLRRWRHERALSFSLFSLC